jgi:competence protein ComEA
LLQASFPGTNIPGILKESTMKIGRKDPLSKAALLFFNIAVIAALVAGISTDAFAKKKKAADEVAPSASAALIDLNTADQKTLESLPGIGKSTAKAIIAGRPYKSVDDLKKVKGISDSKLKAIKDKVMVGASPSAQAAQSTPAVPAAAAGMASSAQKEASEKATKSASKLAPGQLVNINTASKAELDALPGIGPTKSQAIIDGRPYNRIEDIMKVKGIKEGTFNKIKDHITVH